MMSWLECPARRSMRNGRRPWGPTVPSLSSLNNAALLMLQPGPRLWPGQAAADLAGTINGISGEAGFGLGSPLMRAQARISESMFSVNNMDPTAMKVRLIERVGKEFGIERGDCESLHSYGA